ncbi:MAG TPA: hypothetical protein VH231_19125 [Solirubrobacteraceae bacterium]|nr:hypothetical protein [Solirubrobacteraceae bacterium]
MASPQQEEVVDALPVLAERRAVEPLAARPAVQAAAVAATGFVAGAATVAVIRRRGARKALRRRKRSTRRGGEMLEIVSSRSFLVDVHLVNRE